MASTSAGAAGGGNAVDEQATGVAVRCTQTARDGGQRLAVMPEIAWRPAVEADLPSIVVRPQVGYQEILGFGGAITEAMATTLLALPARAQEELLAAYFDPRTGHGYTLARTHINSCDFAKGNYAHAAVEGDVDLAHFGIERDRQALLPVIQGASRVAGAPLQLLASPWSPPAWMKSNAKMNGGGKLREEFRAAWAACYCRFVEEYERAGVRVWGLTVQNEPAATQPWDSCVYTGAEERDFVRDHLGPALKRAHLERLKLLVWDHNRDLMFERAQTVLDDPDAAAYVWGVAFHWYGADCFANVGKVHDAWPDKHLLFTEGCQEGGPHAGSWLPGERYARSMIQDLNHWADGWIDWNLLLEKSGGPNHVGNLCAAPILADVATGELQYQSAYYYLGHFSRFIKPGARRVLAASGHDHLETTAAWNPDGSMAVVVLNRTEQPIAYTLKCGGRGATLTIPPRAIQTLTFKGEASHVAR